MVKKKVSLPIKETINVIYGRAIEIDFSLPVSDDPVILSVIIGNAQLGGSAYWIDKQLQAKGQLHHVLLGPARALIGHSLALRTIVTDVNPHTNNMAVTYILTAGEKEAHYELRFTAPNDNDAVPFVAIFNITQEAAA